MLKSLILLLLMAHSSPASPALDCSEKYLRLGPMSYSRQFFAPDTCFLSIQPSYVPDMIYRSLIFNKDGKLLVFNSYGSGSSETETGARVFYFFPRKAAPDFKIENENVSVSTGTLQLIFDSKTGKITHSLNSTITESEKIIPTNKGGIEFPYFENLILDCGFSMGKDPSTDPNGKSIFRDSQQHSCQVKNREIFSYTDDGDNQIKFNDQALERFLKNRCPELNFHFK